MNIELPEKYQKELEELKKKYGKVRTMIVPLDEDEPEKLAILFLKKPDRQTRNMAWTFVGKGNTDAAITSCLKALHIGGDSLDLVLKSDDAMESVDNALAELLKVQKAIIKKN